MRDSAFQRFTNPRDGLVMGRMSGRPRKGTFVRFALMGRAGFAAHQNRPLIRPNETREARLIAEFTRREAVGVKRFVGTVLSSLKHHRSSTFTGGRLL